jgi:hypothetical protein
MKSSANVETIPRLVKRFSPFLLILSLNLEIIINKIPSFKYTRGVESCVIKILVNDILSSKDTEIILKMFIFVF